MPPAGSSTSSSEADEKYLVACLLWGTVDIVKEVRGESEMHILFSGEVYKRDYMQSLCIYLVLLHDMMMSFKKPDLVIDSLTGLYHILYLPCHLFVLDVNTHLKVLSLY